METILSFFIVFAIIMGFGAFIAWLQAVETRRHRQSKERKK